MINAIIACDRIGGISKNSVMPWPKNSEDLSFFKKMTTNSIVVMGRKTWEATDMPSPLPNRRNIVITQSIINGVETMTLAEFKSSEILDKNIWIIGGSQLLHSCLDIVDKIYLTQFTTKYDCDTFINLDKIHNTFKLIEYYKVDDSMNEHYRLIFERKNKEEI